MTDVLLRSITLSIKTYITAGIVVKASQCQFVSSLYPQVSNQYLRPKNMARLVNVP